MSTILIGGYYGAGNVGDEAILASIVKELRLQRPNSLDLSFIVLSWDPEKTSKELDVKSIHWKDMDALVDSAQRADLIIVGGGGIFHDYWGIDPDTYLRRSSWDITAFGSLPILAKLLDIPCMIYAVGVGPFQSDIAKHHTRLAFERCQVATVRDNESLEYLIQTGLNINDPNGPIIKVLPDPTFTLRTSSEDISKVIDYLRQHNIPDEVPLLGVVLHYWDFGCPLDEWLPIISEGLKTFLLLNEDIHCITIPFQVNPATPFTNDALILNEMAELVNLPERIHTIEEPLSPMFVQSLIEKCDIVVGMRLHLAILALNSGTPVVAIASRPKVLAAMRLLGIDQYCITSMTPEPDVFADVIQKSWKHREDIRKNLLAQREELRIGAKENAQLALELVSNFTKKDMSFQQIFAIEQIKKLNRIENNLHCKNQELQLQLSTAIEEKREHRNTLQNKIWDLQSQLTDQLEEKQNLQNEVWSLRHQLSTIREEINIIRNTRVWKLGQKYYHIRDTTLLKYPYRFIKKIRREGLWAVFRKSKDYSKDHNKEISTSGMQINVEFQKKTQSIINKLNSRSLKGVFVLTSAFEFDEFYNQRVINLSKYLANNGWGVIFIAWVWQHESEAPVKEVKKNIFQVPINIFLETYSKLEDLKYVEKYFVIEFPHPDFFMTALKLKNYLFKIVYDIIDEWEAFHDVGQAIWYEKSYEESIITNANFLSAVSQPLIDKYAYLRNDIHLIPNGFNPNFLGAYESIAQRNFYESEINIGYFGHLTPAWFDWNFLKEILRSASEKQINLKFHLIGYGEPDIKKTMGKHFSNVEFYGKIHPGDLHKYAKDWDCAMIPFKSGELSQAVDPIKIYEYIYFGLPVLVKGINHLQTLPNVYVSRNASQFIDQVINLRDNPENYKQPIDMDQFLWESRFKFFLEILEDESWMSL